MANLMLVKKRSETNSGLFFFFLLLLLISGEAGWLVWLYVQPGPWAFLAGGTCFFLFGILGLWLHLQTSVAWFCRVQLGLSNLNLLPKDFPFWDEASPWNIKSRLDAAFKAALETVQNSEKELASNRHTLDKYLGSEGSRQASKGPSASLGGQVQKVFVLFSDIRGFTSMSEKLTPQETMRVLNQVYTTLGIAIEEGGGEINKFIGDAILAYFKRSGENDKSDAEKVIRAALDMQSRFGKFL